MDFEYCKWLELIDYRDASIEDNKARQIVVGHSTVLTIATR
jgi:hypothetical protein